MEENKVKKEKKQSIFTVETFGVVIILFSALALVCLLTRDAIFSIPGLYVNKFLLGLMGYSSYLFFAWAIFMGVLMVSGKKTGLSVKRKLLLSFAVGVLFLIIHVITMHNDTALTYGEYLSKAYYMGAEGFKTSSGGGLLLALVAFLVSKMLTSVGSYVVLTAVFGLLIYAFVVDVIKNKNAKTEIRGSYITETNPSVKPEISGVADYPVEGVAFPDMNTATHGLFVSNPNDFAFKSKREMRQEERAQAQQSATPAPKPATYGTNYSAEMQEKLNYIKTPVNLATPAFESPQVGVSKPIPKNEEQNKPQTVISENIPLSVEPEKKNDVLKRAEDFSGRYGSFEADVNSSAPVERIESVKPVEPVKEEQNAPSVDIPFIEETDGSSEVYRTEVGFDRRESLTPNKSEEPVKNEEVLPETNVREVFRPSQPESSARAVGETSYDAKPQIDFSSARRRLFEEPSEEQPKTQEQPKEDEYVGPPINMDYKRPPIDLLETIQVANLPQEDHEGRKSIIKRTLGEFHIDVEPQGHVQGPSITRYEVTMPAGVPVNRVVGREKELKLRLKVVDEVRVEAPIPGTDLVGIEVANEHKITVGMREVMEGMAKKKIKPTNLEFVLGKDIVGEVKTDNLAKGPHYLVAGATGSGKSVCLDVMIVSLIMRYSPENLRLMLIDPKRVSFKKYEGLPHLITPKVIVEPQAALNALSWAVEEMEKRYELFESNPMVTDLESYNEFVANDTIPKLPRIVIFFDELADFMEACKRDLEERIRRLAAKSRAAGIHLVLATQRPTVDVITGTIKTNLPSRIALKVMNFVDSQTILSEGGAEALLGNGDMLFRNSSMASPVRIQGAYISAREINNVVTYIKDNNKTYFDDRIDKFINKVAEPVEEVPETQPTGAGEEKNEDTALIIKALALGLSCSQISISLLERRFGVGYNRAGRIIDKMEKMGYISGYEGAKPRKMFITKEEFERLYGPIDKIDY